MRIRERILHAIDVIAYFALMAVLVLLAMTGCGRAERPDKADPTDIARAEYAAAQEQSLALADGGRLLARTPTGAIKHTGDSAFFSGLGMAFFDCDHGAVIEDAILADLAETGGEVTRHPTERHRESSVDQALAVWAGAARRLACPESAERWAAAGSLKPAGGAKEFPFGPVRQLLLHRLGVGEKPSLPERLAVEEAAIVWSKAVLAKRAACFRVHLSYRALRTIETLGESVSEDGKRRFCKTTEAAGLANIDWWCGRADFTTFLAAFEPSAYQYKFQRCAWESSDGNGDQTPPIDKAEAYFETYDFGGGSDS